MPSTIMDLLFYGLNGRSQQLRELWLICFTTTLWFIWKARNTMKHDGRFIGVDVLRRLILGHIQAANRLATGCMFNSLEELRVLKSYNISCRPRRAPRIIEVNWHPPILGWVKKLILMVRGSVHQDEPDMVVFFVTSMVFFLMLLRLILIFQAPLRLRSWQ